MAATASVTIKLLADVRSAQAALARVSGELRGLNSQAAGGGRGAFGGMFGGANAGRQGQTFGRNFGSGVRNSIRSAIGGGGVGALMGGGGGGIGLVMAAGGAVVGGMIKQAYDFAESWTEVEKVVNGADAALKQTAMTTAHQLGVNPNKVAAVMAIGGQMNIPTSELAAYTKTMLMAGAATDMNADAAANMAGQFSNAMNETDPDKWNKILSTVDALADVIPGGERGVMDMAQRFALSGKTAGLSSADVLGYAAFARGVGVDPEMGGSALSRLFIGQAEAGSALRGGNAPDPMKLRESQDNLSDLGDDIALAEMRRQQMYNSKTGRLKKQYRKNPSEVLAAEIQRKRLEREQGYAKEALEEASHPGQKNAKIWAAMSGMTPEEYGQKAQSDPRGTFRKTLEGLAKADAEGNLFAAMDKLGINDIREKQVLAPMVKNLGKPDSGLDALLAKTDAEWANPGKLLSDFARVQASDTFPEKQLAADVAIQAIEKGAPILHQMSLDIIAAMKAMDAVSKGDNPIKAAGDFVNSLGDVEKMLLGIGVAMAALQAIPLFGALVGLGGAASTATAATATTGVVAPAVASGGALAASAMMARNLTDNLVKQGMPDWLAGAVSGALLPVSGATNSAANTGQKALNNAQHFDMGGVVIYVQNSDAKVVGEAWMQAVIAAAQEAARGYTQPVPPTLGGANYNIAP